MIRLILLISCLVSGIVAVQASTERVYMAPMEQSKWTLTSDTPLRCEIEHVIPRFGRAVFFQQSGRALQLRFEANQKYKKNLDVSFRSVMTEWKGATTQAEIVALKSTGERGLVKVDTDMARYAYFELEQGYYNIGLYIEDASHGFSPVSVILSTVNFRNVVEEFESCLAALYRHHFDDVKTAHVHFDFDDEFPKIEEEERALKNMLDYMAVDKSVKQLVISGHADYKGSECYNDSLSARRAWYVYDYLLQSGIEPNRLQVEFYGESRPLKKGKDDRSRALNRRVTVTMHK